MQEQFNFNPHEIVSIENSDISAIITELDEGSDLFEEMGKKPKDIPGSNSLKYMPWGEDNRLPYEIIDSVRSDEVLSQNKLFNTLTLYGSGVKITDMNGEEVSDESVIDFFDNNRLPKFYLEQCNDMKHFFFSVAVIILSKEGTEIVRLAHKEAAHTRFEIADPKTKKINHVFFANWSADKVEKDDIETIELLDIANPLRDLRQRMGLIPDENGATQTATKTRKFAIVNMFPVAGTMYYPFPSWCSIFRSGWFDIKRMIPKAKKAKFKNGASIKYHVEIHRDFWDELCRQEGITDNQKKNERCIKEKENIKNFLTGIENNNKLWISGFYVNPDGKDVNYVKITNLEKMKEGGDWIEDSAEASSMICYADNTHPTLAGAFPGKTQGAFNGSVQRELFTMKQSLEKAYQDILLEPLFVLKKFNKWDVKFDIPIITLTTLDKGKDAEENSLREDKNQN